MICKITAGAKLDYCWCQTGFWVTLFGKRNDCKTCKTLFWWLPSLLRLVQDSLSSWWYDCSHQNRISKENRRQCQTFSSTLLLQFQHWRQRWDICGTDYCWWLPSFDLSKILIFSKLTWRQPPKILAAKQFWARHELLMPILPKERLQHFNISLPFTCEKQGLAEHRAIDILPTFPSLSDLSKILILSKLIWRQPTIIMATKKFWARHEVLWISLSC